MRLISQKMIIGLHLANEHKCVNWTDFDDLYSVSILKDCSPADLDKKKHIYIHRFRTLLPLRFEQSEPFLSSIAQCLQHVVLFMMIS